MDGYEIVQVDHDPSLIEAARAIFREYAASIEHVAGCSLQYQRFEDELAALPGRYAPPGGRIFLARALDGGRVLGCVALRGLPEVGEGVCELKRMYVVPGARRGGIGRALVDRVVSAAREFGYRTMKLDTSSTMAEAQRLYERMGFVPCGAYNADPEPGTRWYERRLGAWWG